MDIRLTGTETECAEAVEVLRTVYQLREVSRFYPNRGATILGRIFVDAAPLSAKPSPAEPVQASAERTDRRPRAALDTGRKALPRSRGRGR